MKKVMPNELIPGIQRFSYALKDFSFILGLPSSFYHLLNNHRHTNSNGFRDYDSILLISADERRMRFSLEA